MTADAWVVEDPIPCPICGREACEDHLPPPPAAAAEPRAAGKEGPRVAAPKLRIYDDVALMNIPAPPCLIEDRIIAGTLVMLYGPPGKYKTFTNITTGLSVTTGIGWFGARVLQRGPVVACVAEGTGRYRYRVAAAKLDAGFSLEQSIKLFTVCDTFSLLDLGAVRAFVAEVRSLSPVLVSLDPLMRFMAGGDDKDSADVARVVEACGLIQQELNATVLLIHHTGWDESRERGSSVLRAAADTVLSQKEDDGVIVLTCEKQKDLDVFEPIRLTRLVVPVFDGSTCVLKLAPDRYDTDGDALTMKHREAFTVLKKFFPDGASHAAWKKALPADFPERTLYRAEQALTNTGYIRREGKRRPVFIPLPDNLTSGNGNLTRF